MQGALDFIPPANTKPITVFIRKGVYTEIIFFADKHNLTLQGEDRQQTVIAYPNNDAFNHNTGINPYSVGAPKPGEATPARGASIYRRGLGAQSGAASLHAMLSEHFQGSVELLLEQHSLVVPASDDTDRRAIARWLADGTIGAIDVWLTRPRPRDVDAFLALVGRLTPAWWPGV